jgi:MbtH protein
MSRSKLPKQKVFKVVVNHEEQYRVMPASQQTPQGWRDAGKTGTEAECLKYVKDRQARAGKK